MNTLRLVSGALICLCLVSAVAFGASPSPASGPFADPFSVTLEDYLPVSEGGFDESIPRPSAVLGHEIGAAYARHDLVVAWFRQLAEISPRVSLVDLGRSYEGRPQITVVITSPSNQRSLNLIQERHMDGSADAPIVAWLELHRVDDLVSDLAVDLAWNR